MIIGNPYKLLFIIERVPVCDEELYAKNDVELFSYLVAATYTDEGLDDTKYLIPFHEISDAGYIFFIISNGNEVKILVGKKEDKDKFIESVEITRQEYDEIIAGLRQLDNEIRGC